MTQKDWQRALRRQAAENELFGINVPFGDGNLFTVNNPKSGRSYTVEYYGQNSAYNRCDCMSFRTNQIGTCKHIEGVSLYKGGKYATLNSRRLSHSSVVLDYPARRIIQLRIGLNNATEMRKAAKVFSIITVYSYIQIAIPLNLSEKR